MDQDLYPGIMKVTMSKSQTNKYLVDMINRYQQLFKQCACVVVQSRIMQLRKVQSIQPQVCIFNLNIRYLKRLGAFQVAYWIIPLVIHSTIAFKPIKSNCMYTYTNAPVDYARFSVSVSVSPHLKCCYLGVYFRIRRHQSYIYIYIVHRTMISDKYLNENSSDISTVGRSLVFNFLERLWGFQVQFSQLLCTRYLYRFECI